MRWDIFGDAKRRAEEQALEEAGQRVLELEDMGYENMDLKELIYHWAAMSSQVPATIESLLSFNNLAIVLPRSRRVIRETVLQKAQASLRSVYGENFDLQVIKPLGVVLWQHGPTTDDKRTAYMINQHGIPADIDY